MTGGKRKSEHTWQPTIPVDVYQGPKWVKIGTLNISH